MALFSCFPETVWLGIGRKREISQFPAGYPAGRGPETPKLARKRGFRTPKLAIPGQFRGPKPVSGLVSGRNWQFLA